MLSIDLLNVAGTKITVTNTAKNLFDLMDTAGSTKNARSYYTQKYANALTIIPEDGDVRYLIGSDPTATEGILLKSGVKYYLPGLDISEMRLIRIAGADVACTVVPCKSEPGESPSSVAFNITASAGTEYTEGETDSSITGTAVLAEGPSDTLQVLQVDASKHLQVDIAADSVGIGGGTQYTEDIAAAADPVGNAQILIRQDTPAGLVSADGDNVARRGTNYGAAFCQMLDSSGNFIDTFGGGTQYDEGDTDSTITGTAIMWEDTGDTLRAVSAAKPLPVDITDSTIAVTQSGTWDIGTLTGITNDVNIADGGNTITVDNGGTFAVQSTLQAGSNIVGKFYLTDGIEDAAVNTNNRLEVDLEETSLDLMLGTDFSSVFGSANIVSATPAVKVEEQGTVTVDCNSSDVTIDNAPGASAVNIQDGGNTITVDQATASNLNCTEANSGAIKTAVEIIDNANTTISSTDVIRVAIFDDSDTQITTFGGGTQYTEDDAAPGNPVAGAISLVRQDTPAGLVSNDGDIVTQRGTNYGAAFCQILDSSGNFIDTFGGSGGTASTDDSTFGAGSGQGTPMMGFVTSDSVDSGDVGVIAMSTDRRMFTDSTLQIGNTDASSSNRVPVELFDSGGDSATDDANNAIRVNVVAGSASNTEYTLGTDTFTEATTKGIVSGVVRNDTLASLVDTDHEITALQVNASGALYIQEGSALDVSAATVTVSATDLDIRDLTHVSDSVKIGDGTETANVNASNQLEVNVNTASGLEVVQDTAADLNVTEASASTIATNTGNVDTNTTDIPNVIGTDGAAGPSKCISIGGTESGGNLQELLVDSDGHLQIDVLTGGGGGVQWDDGDTIDTDSQGNLMIATTGISGTARAVRCEDDGAIHISDGGDSITVDSTTLATDSTLQSVDTNTTNTVTFLSTIDGKITACNTNAVTVVGFPDNEPFNLNQVGGTSVNVNGGNRDAGTQTITLADNDPAVTALQLMDDWDNAASDGASVSGDTAHDVADAGEPVKIGAKAVSFGSDPTEVAAGDRTNLYSTRAGQLFVIGGHPNVLTKQLNITDADGAQTNTNLLQGAVGAGDICVLTHISVACDNANTGDVAVRVGFGASATPANDAAKMVLSHPGIAKGSGMVVGNGGGIIGMGAAGEDLFMDCEDPVGGSVDFVVSYYIIDNS